jgi:hypothetical protein
MKRPPRTRWTSFVTEGRRGLHEDGNAKHRLRVEHNKNTLLIHLSGEDGGAWTCVAVDRKTRKSVVAQAPTQLAAAEKAFAKLYDY